MLVLGGTMRAASSVLLSVLLAGFASTSSDVFDNQLGDINYCKKQCQLTIKNKSPAKDSIMNACHRGCRLYSICQFVNGDAGFNSSRQECQGACQEAYMKLLEQEACSTGCASQPSEPEIQRRKLKAMTLRPKHPTVMEAVSSWCNDIVSSAQSFISSTWTFYLQADDGKVVVFQSQPEMENSLPELQAPPSSVDDDPLPHVNSHTQRPHGVKGHGDRGASKVGGKGKHPVQHADDPTEENDFLGCMSRRSGLPRWILAVCLFLSIMAMLWLTCATLVTAPPDHYSSYGAYRHMSKQDDKKFLLSTVKANPFLDDVTRKNLTMDDVIYYYKSNISKDNPDYQNLMAAFTMLQADEREEAGMLPVKVDLNNTRV